MAYSARALAVTLASGLALAACAPAGDNVAGGGEAEHQGNLTEKAYSPPGGAVDTPTSNGADGAASRIPPPNLGNVQ